MPQTSVPSPILIGVAGQVADLWTAENGDIISVISEEASAGMPFGIGVKKGTADDGVLLFTAISEALFGIVIYTPLMSIPDELIIATGIVGKVAHFPLLRLGRCLVLPETNVTPASAVHVRALATGPNPQVGAFRATADSTNTFDVSAVCAWRSTALAGTPAVLEVNLEGV